MVPEYMCGVCGGKTGRIDTFKGKGMDLTSYTCGECKSRLSSAETVAEVGAHLIGSIKYHTPEDGGLIAQCDGDIMRAFEGAVEAYSKERKEARNGNKETKEDPKGKADKGNQGFDRPLGKDTGECKEGVGEEE